jgi:hypothetical protein
MIKSIKLLTFIFIVFSIHVQAQFKINKDSTAKSGDDIVAPYSVVDHIIPPSPESASLGKYGDWPVSFQSGTPNIEIPIWELKEKNLSLNISLSYHASGMKVDDYSGWVGQNWTLNAGGAVVRSAIGNNDELNSGNQNGLFYTPSGVSQYLTAPIPSLLQYSDYILFTNWGHGQYDLEPDMFFYNFDKYTGSFAYDLSRNLHFLSQSDIKMNEQPFLPVTNTNNRFIITGEDGKIYVFGDPETTHTTTYGGGQQTNSSDFVTAWYLTKIVYPTNSTDINDTLNETITFTYKNVNQVYELRLSESKSGRISGYGCCGGLITNSPSQTNMSVDSKILTEINSSNTRITFSSMVDGELPENSVELT